MEMRVDVRTGLEELHRDQCMRLIGHSPLGRLAVVVAGQPLIFPVNFTLDGNSVVLRTDHGTRPRRDKLVTFAILERTELPVPRPQAPVRRGVYLRSYLRNVARRSETTTSEVLAKRLVGGGA